MPDFLRGKGVPLCPQESWAGQVAVWFVWAICWFGFQPLFVQASSSTALTAARCQCLRFSSQRVLWHSGGSVYLGKEVTCPTGQELCVVTPQDTAGAQQSRCQAARSPAGSCLHGSAACLHCTEGLCSLFVSSKACLLTSSGARGQQFGHASGPSLVMSC